MSLQLLGNSKSLWHVDKPFRVKLIFLSCAFFFVISAYTIMKELKDSIFVAIVGEDFLPKAKFASVFILIPAILLFAFLVDRLQRYQLIYVYSFIYAIGGLTFAYLLGDPQMGLANTVASGDRVFGWLFYFFYEGYSPFVVSLLWAFANSVTDPAFARQGYAMMAAAGKLGGMISALVGWHLFSCSTIPYFVTNDVTRHQVIMAYSSSLLVILPLVVFLLMRLVPERQLHGYEAAYKFEHEHQGESVGLFAGLRMLLRQPYVLGIFSMIFFYEIINVVLNYHRILAARCAAESVSALSCFLFQQIFFVNLAGFLLSFFGTNALVRLFGVRRCLMLVPALTGFFLLIYLMHHDLSTLMVVFIIIRSINYGIMSPLRESLYIPTTKDIKFKSKSWIDSFGSKFSKATGSSFNWLVPVLRQMVGDSALMLVQVPLFAVITGAWFVSAFFLGKRYGTAIAHNDVIGVEKSGSEQ